MNTLTTPALAGPVGGAPPNSAAAPAQPPARPLPPPIDVPEAPEPTLSGRVAELRDASADAARGLLGQVAESLFGKGARIQFNEVASEAGAQFATAQVQTDGGQGAAFSLNESAHFIGKGQIVTADGSHYDFEIELQYDAHAEAAARQSAPSDGQVAPDLVALTGRALPQIKLPGGLDDLFKLLGRELSAKVEGKDGATQGQLTLRLLRLVNTAALLAPKAQPQESPAKVASSYAQTAAAS